MLYGRLLDNNGRPVFATGANRQKMLNVLRDRDEPVKVRLAALQSLGAAAFSVVAFGMDVSTEGVGSVMSAAHMLSPR